MKRFIFILIFLISISPVSAQVMKSVLYDIELNDDQTADMHLFFEFTDEIKEVKIPLDFEIADIETNGGTCTVENQGISLLSCRPPSKFMVGVIRIDTKFKTEKIIQTNNNVSYFHLDVPILWETENVQVNVRLPFRTALIDNELQPLSPSGASIGSDGRRVSLHWDIDGQSFGDVVPVRVRYEFITPIENIVQIIGGYWFILIFVIVIVSVILIFRKKDKSSEGIYSVLNEPERLVVDVISSEPKNEIDQRKLVKISGFSKAKVSRTVNSLVSRGIVESKRIGRKNKLILKKHAQRIRSQK